MVQPGLVTGPGIVAALERPEGGANTRAAAISASDAFHNPHPENQFCVIPSFSGFSFLHCSLACLHLTAQTRSHAYTLVVEKAGIVSSNFTLRRLDS